MGSGCEHEVREYSVETYDSHTLRFKTPILFSLAEAGNAKNLSIFFLFLFSAHSWI